jgi:hypothetical protein
MDECLGNLLAWDRAVHRGSLLKNLSRGVAKTKENTRCPYHQDFPMMAEEASSKLANLKR